MTRDSVVWSLAIVAAILTYLIAAPPPTQWDYYETLKAIAFAVATISGKLATSPLPGKREDQW